VYATTVNRTDDATLRALPPVIGRLMTGLFRPKFTILGLDFAGVIEQVGAGVSTYKAGDHVFGMSAENYGAHAQYLCLPDTAPMAIMPAGIGFEDAVVCEGAWYADTYLQSFGLTHGHKILIYGASGAIGIAALQLARSYGGEVTAVVGTRHVELARSLGADHVIDYTREDFTRIGDSFDFVFDAVGKTTYAHCRRLLKPGGVFSATDLGPWWQNLFLAAWSSITGANRVILPMPTINRQIVGRVKQLMQAGQFKAVIDREYPLAEIADAYRFVQAEQKTGIVVIRVNQ